MNEVVKNWLEAGYRIGLSPRTIVMSAREVRPVNVQRVPGDPKPEKFRYLTTARVGGPTTGEVTLSIGVGISLDDAVLDLAEKLK